MDTTEEILIDQPKQKKNWVFKFKIKIKNSMDKTTEQKPVTIKPKIYCARKRKNHCAKALIKDGEELPICGSFGRCIYQITDLKNIMPGIIPAMM
jgi:hypothetical protein